MANPMEEFEKVIQEDKLIRIDFELSDGTIYVFQDPDFIEFLQSLFRVVLNSRDSSAGRAAG